MPRPEFLFALTGLQTPVGPVATLSWNVSATEFQRMLWMSSVVVDNWLYIDGGEYYVTGASSYDDIHFAPTLSIDLSTSWTAPSVTINQISTPHTPLKQPGLFWFETLRSIVVFGGLSYTTWMPNSIWALSVGRNVTGDGNWTEIRNSSDSMWNSVSWPHFPSYAMSPFGGIVIGGVGTDEKMLHNVTTINATSGTYTTDLGNGAVLTTTGVEEGAGYYVPSFGTGQGIAISLGGSYKDSSGTPELRSMSEITVYDIATKNFYTQTAGGDVPKGRKDICIVGAQESNTTTYEIFVYGGSGTNYFSSDNDDSRNVYILTLPAFRWFRTSAVTSYRAGPSCNVIKNQMLSFGGYDPLARSSYGLKDPWTYGIQIFDLTALTWSPNFNSQAADYIRSDIVNNFYASNSLYPVWDSNAAAALFNASKPTATSKNTVTTATSTSSATSTQSQTSKSSDTPTGAITGGVLGGAAVLLTLGLVIWFCLVRPQKRLRTQKSSRTQETIISVAEVHDHRTYPELWSGGISELGSMQEPIAPQVHAQHQPGPYEVHG